MIKSPLLHGTAVLIVLFGIWSAVALNAAAELAGIDIDWPDPPESINVSAVSLIGAGLWLLIRARRSPHGGAAWCAAGLTIAGLVLLPQLSEAARTAVALLLTGAGAWLCAPVAADHGVPLWQGRLPRQIVRRWDNKALTACVVVLAGHTVAAAAQFWLMKVGPAVTDQAEQTSAVGNGPVMIAVQALAAGVREEIPLLALPAALMAAARRPVWQILLVVCVLRIVPHAYLGSAALGSAVFAAAALWMYRVTHQIGPIIIGHTVFNALALFGGLVGALALGASTGAAWLMLPAVLDDASPRWLRRMFPDKRAVSRSST